MTESVAEHRESAPVRLRVAVLTVSDSRTEATDTSGALIVQRVLASGHMAVDRAIVPDEPAAMRAILERWRDQADVDAVLVTGGTGIAPRDRTVDVVSALITKALPGFGELFRMLSHQEIGAAAMLSRAIAGVMGETLIFVMPGSRAGVALAMDRLIIPELAHAVGLVRPERRRHS